MNAKRLLLLWLTVLLFSISLSACVFQPSLRVLDRKIEVEEYTRDTSQSTAVVTGSVINQGWFPANKVTATASFLDSQSRQVATSSVVKDRLDPGQVWNFRIEMKGPDAWKVARYDLTVRAE